MAQAPAAPEHEPAGAVFDTARRGDTARLASYVDAGVPADLADARGDTLLILAACHGHTATVRMLLEHGADPNARNGAGRTALSGAVAKAETEVVRTLLDGGADPDAGSPSARQAAELSGRGDYLDLFTPTAG